MMVGPARTVPRTFAGTGARAKASSSLKIAALALGLDEITTFRNQARIKPVTEAVGYALDAEVPEATYRPATKTLNLELPQTMGGAELTAWIERVLATSTA